MEEWIGFIALSVVALFVASFFARQQQDPRIGTILVIGVLLRIVGSTLRYEVLMRVYGGVGDASGYFAYGVGYASQMLDLDFSFIGTSVIPDGHWWGSDFIRTIAGFVVLFVGESMRAVSLAFALLAFAGTVLLAQSFAVAVGRNAYGYTVALYLLPSLWFWPASIGKEAVMMLAVGLMVRGHVGTGRHPSWLLLGSGILLAAAVRPHVAALAAASLALAEMLRTRDSRPWSRLPSWLLSIGLTAVAINVGLTGLGLGDADLEGIEEEVVFRATQTEAGGSQIERSSGWAVIPMALINVLMRPFPGEGGVLGFFSGLELWGLWIVVLPRWRRLVSALDGWRASPFLCAALPFSVGLTLLYGIGFANLGIIARQRVVVLPFLLVLPVLALAHGARAGVAAPGPSRPPRRIGGTIVTRGGRPVRPGEG